MKKQYLESGKIVGTHGIKGEVRIDPWCDSPQFLSEFTKLYLDSRGETFIEVKSRPHKNITLSKWLNDVRKTNYICKSCTQQLHS